MAELILEPEPGVSVSAGTFVAQSLPAWLRVVNFAQVCGRNWFSLRYACSFFDRPTRPVIRFRTRSGNEYIYVMNGAVLGTAEWTGRIPDNAIEMSICATDRLGPFAFRIEDARPVSKLALVSRNLTTGMPRTRRLMSSRMSDAWQFEVDLYKIANLATPFAKYRQWHRRFRRAPELYGIDRPRSDWTNGPAIRLMVPVDASTRLKALEATIESLQAQLYHNWSLSLCPQGEVPDRLIRAYRQLASYERRLHDIESNPSLFPAQQHEADWLSVISPGDLLENFALGAAAEEIAVNPDAQVIYSDEDAVTETGQVHSPLLKPDWSPIFHAATDYVGRMALVRKSALTAADHAQALMLALQEQQTLRDVLARLAPAQVVHLRRVLYRRARPIQRRSARASVDVSPEAPPHWPHATIVIITRDRPDLLKRCIAGIRQLTDYPAFDVVVIDNGSSHPEAQALLRSLQADSRFRVESRPIAFNFSAMCNEGAAISQSPLLVFLNNDVEMRERDWLKALARFAMQPHIGLAGAKLLYPNGRIQHAGITLGLGTVSGHAYSGEAETAAGYLNQLQAAREVTAVTGACCAIERRKFDELGGFDATNLPIEFSDIDLCLRARERGWCNVVVPQAVLFHREAETRGPVRSKTYETERKYFAQRWAQVIRDDPYFHPGLSLFALNPALA